MTKRGFGTGICVYCERGDTPAIGEHIFGRQLFLFGTATGCPRFPVALRATQIKVSSKIILWPLIKNSYH